MKRDAAGRASGIWAMQNHPKDLRKGERMAEYHQCKYCKYVDSSETDGYKWYCEWHRIYVDPDKEEDEYDCSHYQER